KIRDKEKRRLSLKARYSENGYFSLEISNSKINSVSEKQGVFMTDKDNQKMHGLGIASMKEIVERYKGTIDIQYTEEEFTVVTLISF
ncbi:MAG: GHKL domain-containing protein, partial [Lachnospiraceae bacterium]|nr:GHKL domain-containing protein [Lachnospiraceae bacterium]